MAMLNRRYEHSAAFRTDKFHLTVRGKHGKLDIARFLLPNPHFIKKIENTVHYLPAVISVYPHAQPHLHHQRRHPFHIHGMGQCGFMYGFRRIRPYHIHIHMFRIRNQLLCKFLAYTYLWDFLDKPAAGMDIDAQISTFQILDDGRCRPIECTPLPVPRKHPVQILFQLRYHPVGYRQPNRVQSRIDIYSPLQIFRIGL